MVKTVLQTADQLGEGPVYVAAEGSLRWVDILGSRWHRLTLASGQVETFNLIEPMTSFAPLEPGAGSAMQFVAAFVSGLAVCGSDGQIDRWLHRPEIDLVSNRFNDGGPDPAGRFLAGTMNQQDDRPTGKLYALAENGELRTLRTGIVIANTVAFSPAGDVLYTADSARRELSAYEYDPATGQLGIRVQAFQPAPELPGTPDGSAVDAEGFLWNARWGGSCVVRLAPDGSLDRQIEMPVSQPTSCAFVGSRLYITSARVGLDDAQLDREPLAGSLFTFETGLAGVPRRAVARNCLPR